MPRPLTRPSATLSPLRGARGHSRKLPFALLLLLAASANAATFLVPDDRTLAKDAQAIIVARAGEGRAGWTEGGWIETATAMRVEEAIKGPLAAGDDFTIVELGGLVGNIGYAVDGSPQFAPGERVLLFLDVDERGRWNAHSMAVGAFAFRDDLLVRDGVSGYDTNGTPHREAARDARKFLRFLRGEDVGYFVDEAPRAMTAQPDAVPVGSYLLQFTGPSGTLGLRWPSFPTPVVFLSHGTQPGAPGGGLTAVQRGMSSWNDDPSSNVVYQYGGTTTIARTGLTGSGSSDGVNTIQFNDPSNEISGSFNGSGTLAIGGAWFSTSTHTFNGEKFYTIVEADLVVQDGIFGPGLTGNGFDHVIAHELGHTLGFRHSDEPPAGGTSATTALMNSTVNFNNDPTGAALLAWDREAVAAVYGSGTVEPPPCTPPSITAQPQPASIGPGSGAVVLTVTASGSTPLAYQWYVGASGVTGSPIVGANGPSVSVLPTTTTSYWVRITNGCDPPANSATAVVTVNGCPAVFITSLSSDQSILEGASVTLSVVAGGGTISAFQWFRGTSGDTGVPIATGPSITVQPAVTSSYWVRVTSSCGATIDSGTVTVTVRPCTAPKIVVQPSGGTALRGSGVSLSATVTGTAPLKFQWYEGTPPDISRPVTNATTANVTSAPIFSATSFWMRVTNDCGTADTIAAPIGVTDTCTAPSITRQPADTHISAGGSAILTVAAGGVSLSYQWYQGQVFDFTHPIGVSAPTLVTPALTAPAQFWVRISSPCGGADSVAATVTPVVGRRRTAAQ